MNDETANKTLNIFAIITACVMVFYFVLLATLEFREKMIRMEKLKTITEIHEPSKARF